MDIERLRDKLVEMNVPRTWYLLNESGFNEEKLCLFPCEKGWEVYWSERGAKNFLKVHEDESSACEDLLGRIVKRLDYLKWEEERNKKGLDK